MKKILLAIIITLSTFVGMSAQETTRRHLTPQQRTEMRIKTLGEKLSLTEEQKTQIRKLYADFNKQKYPKGKRKEAMEKLIADITALLTPTQQPLYEQMQKEAPAKRRNPAQTNATK